jgi:hypothetical protein
MTERIMFKLEEIEDALRDGNVGYCIKCGAEKYDCEPDAREYACDECEEHAVYGAEELLVMGLVE